MARSLRRRARLGLACILVPLGAFLHGPPASGDPQTPYFERLKRLTADEWRRSG